MASSLGFMTINDSENKPEIVNHSEILQDKLSTNKAQELINHLHTSNIQPEVSNELNLGNYEIAENEDNFNEHSASFKDSSYINQYYNEYINEPQQQNVETELMTKINYMIRLLEETSDEKINNVSEEMVLYCFLGVFMIFIVDSFSRVGKYVR